MPLSLVVPADARMLVEVRRTVRRWLREAGVSPRDGGDILIACGEACANVVCHAYGATPGDLRLEGRLTGDLVELTVSDQGVWRTPAGRGGGWGLQLIHGLMDTVDIDRGPKGTEVRMRRGLSGSPRGER